MSARRIFAAAVLLLKKVELRGVPVSENLPLIYNELGIYTGTRLGTPCDDQ